LSSFGRLSIRGRLFVLTLVALLPALLILLFNETQLREERIAEIHATARNNGQLAALEMERIIDGSEATLMAVASVPFVRGFDKDACSAFLAQVVRRNERFLSISAIDSTGLLRCRSAMPAEAVQVGDRPYFRRVIETNRFVVGEYLESRFTGQPSLPLALPLRDDAGGVIGVLVGGVDLAWLGRVIDERELPRNDALTIADRSGVIIARKPFPERFVGQRIPDAFQHLVQAGEPGTLELTSQDGTRRVIGYYPAAVRPEGLYISAGVSVDEMMEPVEAALGRDLAIVVIGPLLAFAAALGVGSSLFRTPIATILETVRRWRAGDQEVRTGMRDGPDEISRLGAAIDGFMDDLVAGRQARRAAEESRELAARELQHRVKNLLATIQAIAVRTFSGNAPAGEAARKFQERLSALAASHELLMGEAWQSAGVREVVERTIRPFGDHNFRLEGPPLRVSAKAAFALAMALHELGTNASKYGALSRPQGSVSIAWLLRDGQFRLHWVERGGPPVGTPGRPGFGSLLIEKVLAGQIQGEAAIRYEAAGLHFDLAAPAEGVLVAAA